MFFKCTSELYSAFGKKKHDTELTACVVRGLSGFDWNDKRIMRICVIIAPIPTAWKSKALFKRFQKNEKKSWLIIVLPQC